MIGDSDWFALLASDPRLQMGTPEERGAFWSLVACALRCEPRGTLPDEERMLSRMAACNDEEWARVREFVIPFWPVLERGLRYNELVYRDAQDSEWRRATVAGVRDALETRLTQQAKRAEAGKRAAGFRSLVRKM